MVLMGGSGAALYMLILKMFLRLYDVGLSGINGINTVGMGTLRNLPLGLKNAYFDFYAYFFTHGIAQNHYGQIAGYLLLFVLAALAGLRWLVVLHDRKAAAANVTDVINTGATVALRMAGSLAIVVPFAIAVIDAAPALTERAFSWGMALCTAFCAVLLRGFAVQVNNDAAVMLKQKTTVVNLANRLCTRLEENADYQNGAEVVILGEPNPRSSPWPGNWRSSARSPSTRRSTPTAGMCWCGTSWASSSTNARTRLSVPSAIPTRSRPCPTTRQMAVSRPSTALSR